MTDAGDDPQFEGLAGVKLHDGQGRSDPLALAAADPSGIRPGWAIGSPPKFLILQKR